MGHGAWGIKNNYSSYLLLITHYLLLITHYLLLITHYSLLMVYLTYFKSAVSPLSPPAPLLPAPLPPAS
jgi:hypothetical protein